MTRIASVGDLAESLTQGRTAFSSFRKVPSQASVAGWWVDLSMAAGNPPPNYYASEPLVAATLESQRGIWTGGDVSPASKVLAKMGLCTPTAGLVGRYLLLDYLLYYPFVDLDDLDAQALDNTVTLPRYEDGAHVLPMLVAVAPTTGGVSTFTFDYVNQDGVARTSPVQAHNSTATSIASLVTSQQAVANGIGSPFLRLAEGDSGVREITSWTNVAPAGGLGALVLVKVLGESVIREINTWAEIQWVREAYDLPVVLDGAYLNLIMNCAATVAAGTLTGYSRSAWK